MDISSYIKAMPKAEVNISLEGAVQPSVWLLIAEQNEISSETRKTYQATKELLERNDFNRHAELTRGLCAWLRYPEDLMRIVYDAGLSLAKQNVRYAEIIVNPSLFMLAGMTFDTFMSALNDGRDRVERGWGITIRWNLAVEREEPRRADDVVRSASSAVGRKHGVLGYGLIGAENSQPVGQFERAFQAATKKEIPTFVRVNEANNTNNIEEALNTLQPSRLVDGMGLAEKPDAVKKLIEDDIPLVMTPARAKRMKAVYPIRELLEKKIALIVSADMPAMLGATTTEIYEDVQRSADLTIDELNEINLNALQYSFLDEDAKWELIASFKAAYESLKDEFITNPAS